MRTTTGTSAGFALIAAETGNEIRLAMQRLWLTGQVLGAGARLLVQHVLRSAEPKPIEVIYAFALPRDAAMRRFTIEGDGFTANSELKPTEEAMKAYEEGIEQGALSTLARQHGDGVVNLSVGNIRPGETVTVTLEILAGVESRDDGFRFRFPFTLAPGYHAKARMLETEPGTGEIELPQHEFGDVILPKFKQDARNLHAVGFDLRVVGALKEVGSPSHGIRLRMEEDGAHVSLAIGKDVPDRDLVLDARRAPVEPEVLSGGGQFIAMVPSVSFGENPKSPRRVVIVLDRSGSMEGDPIAQARKAIEACLGSLSIDDQFGLIAFDDQTEIFRPAFLTGSKDNRDLAKRYLDTIDARGGTELIPAIEAAARMAGGDADVLILTDGQVFATEQILAKARAAGIRLHTLGIGSASQDRFLALLARETGGVSRFVTAQERVDLTAVDLFASIGRPTASGIQVSGVNVQPAPPAQVFAGTPLVVYGEAGEGDKLGIAWTGGSLELPICAAEPRCGETLRLLRGARLITDLESRYSLSERGERRELERIKERLRTLSLTYGLASQEMSLVSVVKRKGDKPGEVPKTQVVAVGMPRDTPFQAYFAKAAFAPAAPAPMMSLMKQARFMAVSALPPAPDTLLDLASSIDDDGGMPGRDSEERILRTLLALLAFLQEGHSLTAGAFRSHVRRLAGFLQAQAGTRDTVARVLEKAERGEPLHGDWLSGSASWKDVEAALHGTITI